MLNHLLALIRLLTLISVWYIQYWLLILIRPQLCRCDALKTSNCPRDCATDEPSARPGASSNCCDRNLRDRGGIDLRHDAGRHIRRVARDRVPSTEVVAASYEHDSARRSI